MVAREQRSGEKELERVEDRDRRDDPRAVASAWPGRPRAWRRRSAAYRGATTATDRPRLHPGARSSSRARGSRSKRSSRRGSSRTRSGWSTGGRTLAERFVPVADVDALVGTAAARQRRRRRDRPPPRPRHQRAGPGAAARRLRPARAARRRVSPRPPGASADRAPLVRGRGRPPRPRDVPGDARASGAWLGASPSAPGCRSSAPCWAASPRARDGLGAGARPRPPAPGGS